MNVVKVEALGIVASGGKGLLEMWSQIIFESPLFVALCFFTKFIIIVIKNNVLPRTKNRYYSFHFNKP